VLGAVDDDIRSPETINTNGVWLQRTPGSESVVWIEPLRVAGKIR
jgi:hypothetical protein